MSHPPTRSLTLLPSPPLSLFPSSSLPLFPSSPLAPRPPLYACGSRTQRPLTSPITRTPTSPRTLHIASPPAACFVFKLPLCRRLMPTVRWVRVLCGLQGGRKSGKRGGGGGEAEGKGGRRAGGKGGEGGESGKGVGDNLGRQSAGGNLRRQSVEAFCGDILWRPSAGTFCGDLTAPNKKMFFL